jgi:hypothetical protein
MACRARERLASPLPRVSSGNCVEASRSSPTTRSGRAATSERRLAPAPWTDEVGGVAANLVSRINQTPRSSFFLDFVEKASLLGFTVQFGTVAALLLIIAERLRRKGSAIMEPRRLVVIWRVTPIAVALLLAGGCSNALQSDQGKLAIAGHEVALAPQTRQRTINEYASHCDEQTRQRQHELANCTAVQLIDIQMEPKS